MTELQNQLVDELNLAGFHFLHAEFNDDGDGKWSFDGAFVPSNNPVEVVAETIVHGGRYGQLTHFQDGLMRIESA